MFFNSFAFIGFFAAVIILLFISRSFGRNVTVRNALLLAASYFFYGYFNIGFTLIMAFVTIVNLIAGNCLFKHEIKKRKRIVAIATVLSFLPLIFYKYALFLCKSFASLLVFELNMEWLDGLLLPVGISFFTFQALSYTIDIYRGKITDKANALDFFLFVAFFPTILSGPIEKARNLLPQIRRYFLPNLEEASQGLCIFIWGLFKKMVIADRLAEYVDWAYATSSFQSGTTLALAAIFYSIQIYCDFSGYSDMALGVAKALGFNITKNFRQPYFSRTFKDFWHKWHIALTSWFTEYVYFSLGGSRVKSKLRWVFNISTIFLLSGIWHGAAWNFAIWGALHAIYYLAEHFLGLQKKDRKWNFATNTLSGLVVFALVTIAWIFFRVESFEGASLIVGRIFSDFGSGFSMGGSSFAFACTMLMLLILVIYELLVKGGVLCFDVEKYRDKLVYNLLATVPLLLMMGMFGVDSDSFVYFKF